MGCCVAFLLGWASLTAITGTVSYWVLFDKFDRCATQNIGKTLSVGEVEAIHYAHLVNEVMVALLCVAAITGAAGGILLAMSNNLRWRLKEHEEQRTPYQP